MERFNLELSLGGYGHCADALSSRTIMKFYLECEVEHMDDAECCGGC